MPKIDYKIDYRSLTAAYYTRYTMSEQFKGIIARNNTRAITIAEHAKETVRNQAIVKARESLFGAKIDVLA